MMWAFAASSLVTAFTVNASVDRAPVAIAYPTSAILGEFGAACLHQEAGPTTTATFENWRAVASKQGWSAIRQAPPPGTDFATRSAFRAYHSVMALDYDLLSYVLATGDEQIEREIMSKTVSGRTVYLSLLAAGRGDATILAQCRLFDPLGDGILKLPIGPVEVSDWVGRGVKQFKAPYSGRGYIWDSPSGHRSLRVHFGFGGKSRARGRYDPYALYGLMLVHDDPAETIIVT